MSSYLLSVAKERWQHDRTQTWDFNFGCACSHGGFDQAFRDVFGLPSGVVNSLGEAS